MYRYRLHLIPDQGIQAQSHPERERDQETGAKDALKKANKKYTLYIYEGANHAFNNDTAEARYNKAAAEQAWSRTIAFLKEHL